MSAAIKTEREEKEVKEMKTKVIVRRKKTTGEREDFSTKQLLPLASISLRDPRSSVTSSFCRKSSTGCRHILPSRSCTTTALNFSPHHRSVRRQRWC